MLSILNTSKNTVIAQSGVTADTFLSRMTGLLNRKSLPKGEALVIASCKSIHMFFMRFPIDVIFVDKNDHVVGLVQRIKPFQMSPVFFKSQFAIELSEGAIEETLTSIGDKIKIEKVNI